ncbi:MAG: hypothetical protein QG597_4475, partial [Actinomycetota bacterium]|nr:hypothetical protein [Actinomycetota bacterium]
LFGRPNPAQHCFELHTCVSRGDG